jgi:hypothetical protein
VDCARCCRSMFAMYVRANSSILISAFTVTGRTNPVKVPGVIVRLWPLAWLTGLQGQVNPLASSENHCSKDSFRARRRRLPFEPFVIAFDRTSTERSCHLGKGPTDRPPESQIEPWLAHLPPRCLQGASMTAGATSNMQRRVPRETPDRVAVGRELDVRNLLPFLQEGGS